MLVGNNAMRRRVLYALVSFTVLSLFSLTVLHRRSAFSFSVVDENQPLNCDLPAEWFNFTRTPPEWLAPPPTSRAAQPLYNPLVIRMAIISRLNDFERRSAVRSTVLKGVPAHEVQIEYKFFVGIPNDLSEWVDLETGQEEVEAQVRREAAEYGDIVIMDIGEAGRYMGEKRWMMMTTWGAAANPSTYDFYMGADTDVFLRMAALSRRLRHLRPNARPRQTKMIWGYLNDHLVHFQHTEGNRSIEDPHIDTDWYPYPLGYAYLLSSALIANLTAPGVMLPHHVHYPADDVIIGNWIYDFARDTEIVNDKQGFHDVLGRSWHPPRLIDWETVGIHHVSAAEMAALRVQPEYAGEWEDDGSIQPECHRIQPTDGRR